MTEIAVTRDLGDGVTYVALIDAVVRSKVGGRWFLDWKTTGSLGPWWDQKQEDSGQFTGQRWAADSLGICSTAPERSRFTLPSTKALGLA